jgi:hypothetical protein
MCESCKQFAIDLLESRIRAILAGRDPEPGDDDCEDVDPEPGDDDCEDVAEAHCFHLLEVARILRGETTCGIYDDYGASVLRMPGGAK